MDSDKCATLKMLEFKHMISDAKVLSAVSKRLLNNQYKSEIKFKVSDMNEYLKHVDQKLFLELIGNKITLD